jgi:hypothetical protein
MPRTSPAPCRPASPASSSTRDQGHRAVLPDRSGRGRLARRHGRHARLGHERRALRHDARERARPDGGHRRRQGDPHRRARQEVLGRLRPDPPVRGLRGHARHHHRGVRAPVPGARGDVGRGLQLPDAARRGRHRHRDHPARRAGRAQRVPRRGADRRAINAAARLGLREAPTLFFEFHGSEASCASRPRSSRRSPARTAARTSNGRPAPRTARGSGTPGTPPTSRPAAAARAAARSTDTCVPISRLAESVTGHARSSIAAIVPGPDPRPRRRRQLPRGHPHRCPTIRPRSSRPSA